jgi:hypothetical protein
MALSILRPHCSIRLLVFGENVGFCFAVTDDCVPNIVELSPPQILACLNILCLFEHFFSMLVTNKQKRSPRTYIELEGADDKYTVHVSCVLPSRHHACELTNITSTLAVMSDDTSQGEGGAGRGGPRQCRSSQPPRNKKTIMWWCVDATNTKY